ncbi:MAG: hypothetical protein P8J87_00235 [Verrucomicrobiales bacterium]|nr:hypothetical protein [Verrucomicrobiales bacterium]
MKTIPPLFCLLALSLLHSSCQDGGYASGSSALEEEQVTLQRAMDRLVRSNESYQRSIQRASRRTSLSDKEREQRFDNDSGLRAQVELLQLRVDTLNQEFATYQKNCQIGNLNLDGN